MTPLSTGHKNWSARMGSLQKKRAPYGALFDCVPGRGLFDLGFLEFHVFLGNRIIFSLGKLVSHRARILAGHIKEARIRARDELDLDGSGFCHGKPRNSSILRCSWPPN